MNRATNTVTRMTVGSLCLVAILQAQAPRKADWLTDGGDIQRTAWQKNETILTKRQRRT